MGFLVDWECGIEDGGHQPDDSKTGLRCQKEGAGYRMTRLSAVCHITQSRR